MKESFEYIMANYIKEDKKVDSSSMVYQRLCKVLPSEIREIIHNQKDYSVKGSMGQGNKADYPWVSILNKNITTSTQRGLYVVFLFKKNMEGFYLTINQGITNFDGLYKKDKYTKAITVANYFKEQIDETTFSKEPINIGGIRGDLGYGYECTTVLQKYYPKNEYSEDMLKNDLLEIMSIYDFMAKHFATQSYDDVIKGVLADEDDKIIDAESAITAIKEAVDPDDRIPYGFNRELIETKPYKDRTNKFKKVTSPKTGKIDYLKKSAKDAAAGLLGEELVIKHEQDRLTELGLEEYADKVKWISQESDAYGYDIESYDVDTNGVVFEIKIEVKTTVSRVDTEFFVSKNELNKSKEYKDKYCIYRVYDVYAQKPKFYRAFGDIEKNFILDPYTYMARYKYEVGLA